MRNLVNVQIRLDPDTIDKLRRELIFENEDPLNDNPANNRQQLIAKMIKQTIRAREEARQKKWVEVPNKE